jgi:hypothetical protein
MRKLFILLCSLTLSVSAYSASISGTVLDKTTGLGMDGIAVYIYTWVPGSDHVGPLYDVCYTQSGSGNFSYSGGIGFYSRWIVIASDPNYIFEPAMIDCQIGSYIDKSVGVIQGLYVPPSKHKKHSSCTINTGHTKVVWLSILIPLIGVLLWRRRLKFGY